MSPVPVSIESYRKHHVTKQVLHSVSINLFRIAPELRDLYRTYYLKYWSGEYLMDRIEDGTLADGDEMYLVVYKNCTPFQVRRSKQVALSFRAALPEYGIPAYVLVRPA